MNITDLKPKLVWQCFDEITKVPRPTHHLDKMKDFLTGWAERHNLRYATDAVGNVVMYCPPPRDMRTLPLSCSRAIRTWWRKNEAAWTMTSSATL